MSSNVVALVWFWLPVRSGHFYYPFIWDPASCNQAVLTGRQKCLAAKLSSLTLKQDDQAECIAGIQVRQVNALLSSYSSSKTHSYLQKSLKLCVLMDW